MGDAPPDIVLRLGTPERRGEGFVVPVAATNRGDETAEGIHIEVMLRPVGQASAASSPSLSSRAAPRAGLGGFPHRPALWPAQASRPRLRKALIHAADSFASFLPSEHSDQ